jgi:hypothetical protein
MEWNYIIEGQAAASACKGDSYRDICGGLLNSKCSSFQKLQIHPPILDFFKVQMNFCGA